jgi:alpha-methylacyl-CoA racemase
MSEWCARLEGTDACFAPALRVDEAVSHPHLAARGSYVTHEGVLQPGPSPRFSRTPGAIQGPPPLPGQDAAEIAEELHLRPSAPDP